MKTILTTLTLAAALATASTAFAHGSEATKAAPRAPMPDAAACADAKQSAQFEFERQRTDGNVSPFFHYEARGECAMAQQDDDGMAKKEVTAANAQR